MPKVRWYQNILIIFCFFVYFFPFKAYGFDPRLLVFLFFFIYMIKDGLLLNRKVKCLDVFVYSAFKCCKYDNRKYVYYISFSSYLFITSFLLYILYYKKVLQGNKLLCNNTLFFDDISCTVCYSYSNVCQSTNMFIPV